MVKRCVHDVVYDLLKSIQEALRPIKSRICRASNLPLDRCEKVLELMESCGLIYSYFSEGRRIYEITERGYQYMGVYEKLLEAFPVSHEALTRRDF